MEALRVLHIEDSEEDARLVARELEKGYRASIVRAATAEHTRASLAEHEFDLILCDHQMSRGFHGPDVLALLKEMAIDVPCVVVTGSVGETAAKEMLALGADNYVMKSNLERLLPAIELTLRNARETRDRERAERALMESEERYRHLVEMSPDALVILQDGNYQFVSPTFYTMFGYTEADVARGMSFFELVRDEDKPGVLQRYQDRLAGKEVPRNYIIDLVAKDGRIIPCETSATVIEFGGRPADLAVIRDISARKQAENRIATFQNRIGTLSTQLAATKDKERQVLAQHLHDEVGPRLALAKLKLGAVGQRGVRAGDHEALAEIQKLIEETIAELRFLSLEISPAILDEMGLTGAVEWLGDRIERYFGVSFRIVETPAEMRLSKEQGLFLFLVTRELLIGIAQYAKARELRISIKQEENTLRVEVAHDGNAAKISGTDADGIVPGDSGLVSVRERVRIFGGRLELDLSSEEMTRVSLEIPVDRD